MSFGRWWRQDLPLSSSRRAVSQLPRVLRAGHLRQWHMPDRDVPAAALGVPQRFRLLHGRVDRMRHGGRHRLRLLSSQRRRVRRASGLLRRLRKLPGWPLLPPGRGIVQQQYPVLWGPDVSRRELPALVSVGELRLRRRLLRQLSALRQQYLPVCAFAGRLQPGQQPLLPVGRDAMSGREHFRQCQDLLPTPGRSLRLGRRLLPRDLRFDAYA